MVHLRKRHLSTLLEELLRFSPIVGVLGHRQVGKTTLASTYAKEYLSLDRITLLDGARGNPENFITNRKQPCMIDECQLAPELFSELKELVRENKRPGQFILSGSVRFTSRKAIRESLTGRIINLELLPFTLSEMDCSPIPQSLSDALRMSTDAFVQKCKVKNNPKKRTSLDKYLKTGGLPGIAFTRNPILQASQFESHIETVLRRDLDLVYNTRLSHLTLIKILSRIAETQGKPLNHNELRTEFRLSDSTLKGLLDAFEALFLIRRFSVVGGTKRQMIFFEDTGLSNWLYETKNEEKNLVRGLYANLREQLQYSKDQRGSIFQFLKASGAYIPLCFKTSKGIIGLIPLIDSKPNRSALMCANSFQAHFPNALIIIVHSGQEYEKISKNIISLPYSSLLSF